MSVQRAMIPGMRLLLVGAWWVSCVAVTWWVTWDHFPAVTGIAAAAAMVFAVLVLRCGPRRGGVRMAVYLAALVANQVLAAAFGVRPLLPGHSLHPIRPTLAGLVWTAAAAGVAVMTFVPVRSWVSEGRRRRWVPRRRLLWRHTAGLGATAAVSYMVATALPQWLWHKAGQLVNVVPSAFPYAPGGLPQWEIAGATGSIAGAVEEPVYVGLLVLLWPRLRAKTVAL